MEKQLYIYNINKVNQYLYEYIITIFFNIYWNMI